MFVIRPLTRIQINDLIRKHHRHHRPTVGFRWASGCFDVRPGATLDFDPLIDGVDVKLVGAVSVGRPVGPVKDQYLVVEATLVVTDGSDNACSFLYGRSARVAREMGFRRIQTYILASEPGTSLKAAGWVFDGIVKGAEWTRASEPQLLLNGETRWNDHPTEDKARWVRDFR